MAKKGLAERFWEKVDKSGDCWEWKAKGSRYGSFRMDGKNHQAHRVSLLLEGVDVPSGMVVCHSCDNTLCVRPDHLFIGTQDDNIQDMIQKGRYVNAGQHPGEGHTNSKLTEEEVKFIRSLRGVTHQWIADQYDVSRQTISKIRANQKWKHV